MYNVLKIIIYTPDFLNYFIMSVWKDNASQIKTLDLFYLSITCNIYFSHFSQILIFSKMFTQAILMFIKS